MSLRPLPSLAAVVAACTALGAIQQQTPPSPPAQSEISLVISSEIGAPPRYAVPDFISASEDADTSAAARTIAQVLWDDLAFEREFYLIPRDTYRTIPAARSVSEVPLDRWRELGADGLLIGSVQRADAGLTVDVRLINVSTRQVVFSKQYSGPATNPRLFAHTIADEVHQQQRGLQGVARTRLTFSSDRDGERVGGSIADRSVKEIYIADYDGANQRRVTVSRGLNITPVWTPDARGIAYTSYRRGFPDIVVSMIYQGTLETPGGDAAASNWLPAYSPDGTRICFTSSRDGNSELYVMNRDGTGVRRLTNNPAIDTTPTWSPTGTQIAFTSDRSGSPQVWVVGADGLNARQLTRESYCDRAAWSPPPFNEIAYSSRTGNAFDLKIMDLASGAVRQLTFGEGSNESPSYSPNGRHLAFTSTRSGRTQLYTVARDGRGLRQITRTGNNFTPNWSR
jgi:TolB protein